MRKILYKKHIDLEKREKAYSIHSETEDRKCRTEVRKSFMYAVSKAKESKPRPKLPLVFIRKTVDTKKGIEEFGFHVKGHFHITHKGEPMKVRFHHTLDITIRWKAQHFSPNKSANLT